MSRYQFACSTHGPAVALCLLADPTADNFFGDDESFQKAKKDNGLQSRLKSQSITPEDMDAYVRPIFEKFATTTDPSAERGSSWKYLSWICSTYLDDAKRKQPVLAEDLYKIKKDLQDFEAFRQPGGEREALPVKKREIGGYRSYSELKETLQPYQNLRDARKAAKNKASEKIMAETTVVYDGDEGKIVIPHTKESCQFWGMQTRWCIAATGSNNYFDSYNKRAPIYVYLPNPSMDERRVFSSFISFKFAGTDGKIYNEQDLTTLTSIPSMTALIDAAKEHLQQAQNARSGLTGYWNKISGAKVKPKAGTLAHLEKYGALEKLGPLEIPPGGRYETYEEFKAAFLENAFAVQMAPDHVWSSQKLIEDLLSEDMSQARQAAIVKKANGFLTENPEFAEKMIEIVKGRAAFMLLSSVSAELKADPEYAARLIGKGLADAPRRSYFGLGSARDFFGVNREVMYSDPVVNAVLGNSKDLFQLAGYLEGAPNSVSIDKELFLTAVKNNTVDCLFMSDFIQVAPASIRNDKELMSTVLDLVEEGYDKARVLEAVGPKLQEDRAFMMRHLRQAGIFSDIAMRGASPSIKQEWFFKTKSYLRWDKLFLREEANDAQPPQSNQSQGPGF